MQSGILPRGRYKNKPQLVLRSSFPLAGVVYCLSLVCPVCFVFVSFHLQSPTPGAQRGARVKPKG